MFNLKDRNALFELIEEGELISETPSKYDIHCQVLIRRDGKLFMLEYLRSVNDGVLEYTARINEVTARQITTTVYDRVPKTA